jgi:hypothetical protein
MPSFPCAECAAIYRELREAAREAGEVRAPSQDLAGWLSQRNEEECARMRENSRLWRAWRRLREHRAVTGHSVSLLSLPPDAISNPN